MDENTAEGTIVIDYNGPSLQEQVVATLIVTVVATAAPFLVLGAAVGISKAYTAVKNKVQAKTAQKTPIFTED